VVAVTRCLVAVAALSVGLASLACVGAGSLHERRWVEARTPNFTILSCRKHADAVELARNLEIFRSIAEFTVGRALPTSPVPTTVYALDTPVTYAPFGDRGTGGFFLQTMRDNSIVIGGRHVTGVDPILVIKHEYVHFLLSSHGGFDYPPWYHEGFAEFLGNTEIHGDAVTIGATPRHRLHDLVRGRLTVDELLEVSYGSRVPAGDFYATSWALVHYLNFGRSGSQDTTGQLTRYFRAVSRGASVGAAVRQGFGISVEQLARDLDDYLGERKFKAVRVGIENFGTGAEPEVRIPSKTEIAVQLGELLLARERFEPAGEYFESALAIEPGSSRAQAGIADVRSAQGRNAEADAAYMTELELAPDDPEIFLRRANHLLRVAEADDAGRSTLAREARSHYVKSWKLDASIPETYAMYGSTYLLDGQDPTLGVETLERAHELLPSSAEITIRLARLKLATGRPAEARKLALSISIGFHDEEIEERIEEVLAATGGP
jgi:Flp pilus assembly protein TadD